MIELTLINGDHILVNLSNITLIKEDGDRSCVMVGKQVFYVKESYFEITNDLLEEVDWE